LNVDIKSRNQPASRTQFAIIAPFVFILALLAGLSLWELKFQDGGRVFLIGEDLLAAAQKRATFCLFSYSVNRSDQNLQCFKSEVDVLLGDMQARRELDTPRQDYSIISEGFVRGRIRPQDVSTAIIFYNIAPWNKEVENAIQIWRDSDRPILRLVGISNELQKSPSQQDAARLRQEISDIDVDLSRQEREFAVRLNNGMHFLSLCLCVVDGTAALILVCLAVFVSRRIMIARTRTQEQVRSLAFYDALSGLPNRILLQTRLDTVLAETRLTREKLAVLFLDLDQFKVINDSLGHSVGDSLLKEVARRLQEQIRDRDTVARVGGDEFLVLLTNLEETGQAKRVADRILKAISAGFSQNRLLLNVTCSVGISMFPENGEDCETLIKNAEAAMYCAKEAGRNRVRFFAEQMNTGAVERLNMENNLRLALERREFHLEYQPQMEIANSRITGVEALLRWRHPDLGLIPPDRFISVAENCGLILPIGEWVLYSACAQARRWQDDELPAMPVAVNVSAVQFRQEGFCELIRNVLDETRLAPHLLELELTESLLLSNEDVVFRVLDDLQSMGVKLTIDDFGTGYSSLSYLKQFPVTKLKIDRTFIKDLPRNPSDTAITTAIISMARHLNLRVIAEGVETEQQLSFLRTQQCDEIQGYYFSRPVPATDIPNLLLSTRQVPFGNYGAFATDVVQ
jgi:diguanylate cyclase (GGDEF)-like protein